MRKAASSGRRSNYTTRDEKFKPDVGLAMAKELVMREKVDILAGTINSSATLAISDFARKEKIPFICSFAKSEKITGEQGHRYVFSVAENTRMIGKAAAVALSKKPYTKYWIAGEDYEYGHAVGEATWRYIKAMKPEAQLLGQTWWKVGEADLWVLHRTHRTGKARLSAHGNGRNGKSEFHEARQGHGSSEADGH